MTDDSKLHEADEKQSSDLEQRENNIRAAMDLVRKQLECRNLLAFIFNPVEGFGGGEIKKDDANNISGFLEGLNINDAIILLHGPGGDFQEGLLITHVFRKKFSFYKTFVPLCSSSSLNLIVLKSDFLIKSKIAEITQVDPLFLLEGEWKRAVDYMHDSDPVIQERASKIFHVVEQEIYELVKTPPSLYNHKKSALESIDWENILTGFLIRKDHADAFPEKGLDFVNLKIRTIEDHQLDTLSHSLITQVQEYLMITKNRYFLGSTQETNVKHKPNPECSSIGKLLFAP